MSMRAAQPTSVRCPCCKGDTRRAIYYGLPVRMCRDDRCGTVWGHWSFGWLLPLLPFNGWFMVFEGSYWRALWYWLTAPREE